MRECYLGEITFPSTDHVRFFDLTEPINEFIKRSKAETGFCLVGSRHTSLGMVVQELAEPNLLKDIIEKTLELVPEDRRSSHAIEGYPYPLDDYLHRCKDNPFRDPGERDDDFNAGSHIRVMVFTQPYAWLPIEDNRLFLGKYQGIAALECDGRNGTSSAIRQRLIQARIYPFDKVTNLGRICLTE